MTLRFFLRITHPDERVSNDASLRCFQLELAVSSVVLLPASSESLAASPHVSTRMKFLYACGGSCIVVFDGKELAMKNTLAGKVRAA